MSPGRFAVIGVVVLSAAAHVRSQPPPSLAVVATDPNPAMSNAMFAASRARFTSEQKSFWAFQPLKRPALPTIAGEGWSRSPIDRFILARLKLANLTPNPVADRRTLIRRATYTLTGLHPSPDEIDAFINDPSPDAFEKVVDRLLASPHYGEHWGRHWLDVVRYAETTANDANAVMRYAFRYRDYVVRALNADKPYAQFVAEQLAGDLMPREPGSAFADRTIATGFLMVGAKALAETDKEQSRLDVIDDQIDVIGRTFLGLTVACARCHDHKFDPIPTADYYGMAGILRGTEVFRDDVRNASMWQEWPITLGPFETPIVVMAPKEGRPVSMRIAVRGNYQTRGAPAPRRYLQIIAGEGHAPISTRQSGRLELARWITSNANPLTARVIVNRVWQQHFGVGLVTTSDNFGVRGEKPSHPELLDWLASEFIAGGWSLKKLHRSIVLSAAFQMSNADHPLALRIDPGNRFLWKMPRRRMSAEAIRDSMLQVAGNLDRTLGGSDSCELLFREGEVIDKNRDFFRPNRVQADHSIYTKSNRRSVYLPVVRNATPDIFALFDGSDANAVTATRNETTVASQALFLMNHPFVREQSRRLAQRGLSSSEPIRFAHRHALGREPSDGERASAKSFLDAYERMAKRSSASQQDASLAAMTAYCQTLLCRNEFLYVD